MNEEETLEKIKHIDRYKDSGDTYTRDDVCAISNLLNMYEQEKYKRMAVENDINYLKIEIQNLLSKV